jgi:hypothetical protein
MVLYFIAALLVVIFHVFQFSLIIVTLEVAFLFVIIGGRRWLLLFIA